MRDHERFFELRDAGIPCIDLPHGNLTVRGSERLCGLAGTEDEPTDTTAVLGEIPSEDEPAAQRGPAAQRTTQRPRRGRPRNASTEYRERRTRSLSADTLHGRGQDQNVFGNIPNPRCRRSQSESRSKNRKKGEGEDEGKGRALPPPLSQKAQGRLNRFVRDGHRQLCEEIVSILAGHPDLTFSASQIKARLKKIREFSCLHGNKKEVKEHMKSLRAINCDDRAKVNGPACFGSRIVAGLSVICGTPENFGLLLIIVSVYPSPLSIISSSQ